MTVTYHVNKKLVSVNLAATQFITIPLPIIKEIIYIAKIITIIK